MHLHAHCWSGLGLTLTTNVFQINLSMTSFCSEPFSKSGYYSWNGQLWLGQNQCTFPKIVNGKGPFMSGSKHC